MHKSLRQFGFVLCLGAGFVFGSVPVYAGTPEGIAALQSGDYARALRELSYAARQGDIKAEYLYATMLKDGLGLPAPDLPAAFSWYKQSAEAGYPDAQLNLGFMMYHGVGTTLDKDGSMYWYEKSAKQGIAAAQYNLGKIFWDGSVGVKDPAQAQSWFLAAAKQGMPEAQFALGVALSTGREPQYDLAFSWFSRAAAQGERQAYGKLAGLYVLGQGVKADQVLAAKWAVLAEGAGDPIAKHLREKLDGQLSPEQKSQAMSQAKAFRPQLEK